MKKTLLLVSGGLGWADRNEVARRQRDDEMPRVFRLVEELNAVILDEEYLKSVESFRRRIYDRLPLFMSQVLEALSRRNEYDAIVSWAEHLGLPLAGLFSIFGRPCAHVAIFSWISKPKKGILLKLFQRQFDRVILMSSAQRDYAVKTLRIPESRIVLLKWPMDQQFWRPMPVNATMICSVGREMRDYATLVEAMRGLPIKCHIAAGGQLSAGKRDPWMHVLSGPGELPANITVGGMKFRELRDLYARSRFVVMPLLPTKTDNGSTSILEAMAMGKSVICSRVAGQRDIIIDGETGVFVPAQDPRALKEAIVYLWEHPERTEEMGRAARTYVEREHSLDRWVRTVRDIVGGVKGIHVE